VVMRHIVTFMFLEDQNGGKKYILVGSCPTVQYTVILTLTFNIATYVATLPTFLYSTHKFQQGLLILQFFAILQDYLKKSRIYKLYVRSMYLL